MAISSLDILMTRRNSGSTDFEEFILRNTQSSVVFFDATGSLSTIGNPQLGSLFTVDSASWVATSSYSHVAVSASHAGTSSYVINGFVMTTGSSHNITSSWSTYASTASYIAIQASASYSTSASYALNAPNIATGSKYNITSSWATSSISSSHSINSDYSVTASYVTSSNISGVVVSASYALNAPNFATGSSHNITSSWSVSSSYAINAPNFSTGSSHNITSSWAVSASYAINAPNFSTGSSHNITSSWAVSSSYAINAPNFSTGSSHSITSSWSQFSITSSFSSLAASASYLSSSNLVGTILNAVSSSYALNAPNFSTGSSHNITSSWASNSSTASYVLQAVSSSYALNAPNIETGSKYNITSSWATSSISASYALNAPNFSTGSSHSITSSWATSSVSSSYTVLADTASFVTASNVIGTVLSSSYSLNAPNFSTGSSHNITSSWAVNSSASLSSSVAVSSSNALYSVSASSALSSSTSISSSAAVFSLTASFALTYPLIGTTLGSGSRYFITSSWATSSISSSYALQSDSASFVTASNVYGVIVSSSFASRAHSASYAPGSPTVSSSHALNADTASYITLALSASYAPGSPTVSSSHALVSVTSSYSHEASHSKFSDTATSASYALNAPNFATGSSHNITSSWSVSSSYSITASYISSSGVFGTVLSASYALNAPNFATGSSHNITSSWATSSSFAVSASAYLPLTGGDISGSLTLTSSGLLRFGGATNAFPALKRNGTYLQVRFADDSDYTSVEMGPYLFMKGALNQYYNEGAAYFRSAGNAVFIANPSSLQVNASIDLGAVGYNYANCSIVSEGAGLIAFRNGDNTSVFNSHSLLVYGDYTSSANYVRAALLCEPSVVRLSAQTGGTGRDDIDIVLSAAGTGSVRSLSTISASTFLGTTFQGTSSFSVSSSNSTYSTSGSYSLNSNSAITASYVTSSNVFGLVSSSSFAVSASAYLPLAGTGTGAMTGQITQNNTAGNVVNIINSSAGGESGTEYRANGVSKYELFNNGSSDFQLYNYTTTSASLKVVSATDEFRVAGSLTVYGPAVTFTGNPNIAVGAVTSTVAAGYNNMVINGVTEAGIILKQSGTSKWQIYDNTLRLGFYNFTTTSESLSVIQSSNNVGVGITSPAQALEISRNVATSFTNSSNLRLSYQTQPTVYYNDFQSYFSGNTADNGLKIVIAGGGGSTIDALKLTQDGRVLFNGGNAGGKSFEIKGASGMGGSFTISNNDFVNSSTGTHFSLSPAASSGNTYYILDVLTNGGNNSGNMVLQSSTGLLGVGQVSPNAKLDVLIPSAGVIGQIIKGAASQTANLQEWQNSSDVVLAMVSASGVISGSSFKASSGFTGSLFGSASYAETSSYSLSASYSDSGSWADYSLSSSYSISASAADSSSVAISSSYAMSSSYTDMVYYGSAPGFVDSGSIWMDLDRKSVFVGNSGLNHSLVGTVYTQTSAVNVSNTTGSTSLTGSGVGPANLPPNFLTAGKTVRFRVKGVYSAVNSPTVFVKVKLNEATGSFLPISSGNGESDVFMIESDVTCITAGAPGTVNLDGYYMELHNTGSRKGFYFVGVPLDTTTMIFPDIEFAWGTEDAGNTLSTSTFSIEILN